MSEMVEKVARAIYPVIVNGTDYSEVSFESMMERPRYQHLREQVMFAAGEAIKAMRPLPAILDKQGWALSKDFVREYPLALDAGLSEEAR